MNPFGALLVLALTVFAYFKLIDVATKSFEDKKTTEKSTRAKEEPTSRDTFSDVIFPIVVGLYALSAWALFLSFPIWLVSSFILGKELAGYGRRHMVKLGFG